MKKFKYRDGDIVAYGIEFKGGQTVEVTDPFVIGKLSNNRFFTEVDAEDVEFTETKRKSK